MLMMMICTKTEIKYFTTLDGTNFRVKNVQNVRKLVPNLRSKGREN